MSRNFCNGYALVPLTCRHHRRNLPFSAFRCRFHTFSSSHTSPPRHRGVCSALLYSPVFPFLFSLRSSPFIFRLHRRPFGATLPSSAIVLFEIEIERGARNRIRNRDRTAPKGYQRSGRRRWTEGNEKAWKKGKGAPQGNGAEQTEARRTGRAREPGREARSRAAAQAAAEPGLRGG